MADEFISFDKVLRELAMEEEELKRLVSEGEIRAFRDQDKMKFKKEDVERFKRARDTSNDDTVGKEEIPEELVFDEDDANQEVGMATAAIADDSFLEEDKTAPETAAAPATAPKAARSSRSAAAATRKRMPVEVDEASEGAGWKILIMAGAIVLVLGLFVAMDMTKGSPQSGLTKNLADMFKAKG